MISAGKMGGTRVRLRSFTNSLPFSLLRARETVMARFRVPLRMFNITEQQWRVLRALSSVEKIEVTVLARATCLLPPSLSRILKDLEDRGLISKSQDMDDLRRSIVSISPSGLKLIDAATPHVEEIYGEMAAAFGEERMSKLQSLLSELETTVGTLPPVSGTEDPSADVLVPKMDAPHRGRPRKNNA